MRSHPGQVPDPPKPLAAVPRLIACPQKTRRFLRHRTPNAATRGMPPSVAVDTLPKAPHQTMKNTPSHRRFGSIVKKCCIKNTQNDARTERPPALIYLVVSACCRGARRELERVEAPGGHFTCVPCPLRDMPAGARVLLESTPRVRMPSPAVLPLRVVN